MISAVFIFACLVLGLLLDERFSLSRGDSLVRLAAAVVLGFFWGTWFVYLAAWCGGFSVATVAGSTAALLGVDYALWRHRGASSLSAFLSFDRKFWKAHILIVLVVVAFFVFPVWIADNGDIRFFGNFMDMAFHMGTVSAFLEQSAFPPFNPQFATAKLSYHFMADFLAAILCRGGLPLFYSLKLPMVMLGFSLGTLVCHLFHAVAGHRLVSVSAGILFFLGHVGFFNLLFEFIGSPLVDTPLTLTSWAGIEDRLTYPYFNFLNVLVDFFQPQLAFLFGFPLAALLLLVLFRKFSRGEPADGATYLVAAMVALMPLFHMHSFLVLAPVTALFVLFEPRAASGPGAVWGRFGVRLGFTALAGAAVALQLAFVLSQKKVANFSGFDVLPRLNSFREIPNFLHLRQLWFWVRAGGAPFVFGLAGFFLSAPFRRRIGQPGHRPQLALLAFFGVTTGYFLVINVYRFTPNWGDSNKFFLFWDLALCLYSGRLLAQVWSRSWWRRGLVCAVLFFGAVGPVAIEWNLRLRREPSMLFTQCDRAVGEWIRQNTPKDAVFLTANTYTHYVTALGGRRVVNGAYTRETGYADDAIEAAVRDAFWKADPSRIAGVHVDYLVVGPEEKYQYHISLPTMARRHKPVFEQTCMGRRYSIYQVQPVSPEDIARDRQAFHDRDFVWLSELDASSVQQYGSIQYDLNYELAPLRLNGETYDYGIGTHAPSRIAFEINEGFTTFLSDIGVDVRDRGSPGSVIFRVEVDGKEAYKSEVLRAGAPHETVRVDVTGAHTLTLIVDDAGDGNHDDHADWAGARLIRRAP